MLSAKQLAAGKSASASSLKQTVFVVPATCPPADAATCKTPPHGSRGSWHPPFGARVGASAAHWAPALPVHLSSVAKK